MLACANYYSFMYSLATPEEHKLALSPYAFHEPPSLPLPATAPTSAPMPSVSSTPSVVSVATQSLPTAPHVTVVASPAAAAPVAAAESVTSYAAFTETDNAPAASPYATPEELNIPQPKVVKTISAYASFDAKLGLEKSSGSYAAFNDESKESVYKSFVLEGDMRPAVRREEALFAVALLRYRLRCAAASIPRHRRALLCG